jgi:hypothetical protein
MDGLIKGGCRIQRPTWPGRDLEAIDQTKP